MRDVAQTIASEAYSTGSPKALLWLVALFLAAIIFAWVTRGRR